MGKILENSRAECKSELPPRFLLAAKANRHLSREFSSGMQIWAVGDLREDLHEYSLKKDA
jgi:hypothetical protein